MVTKLPWKVVTPLGAREFAAIRRETIFECCKWDPQVEDVCTLSDTPIVLANAAWRELVGLAERLARECLQAEREILQRPELWQELALPWSFRRRLRTAAKTQQPRRHFSLIRFDFHFTTGGWKISEANSDVPGGFNEAGFTRLMARRFPEFVIAGNPAGEITAAIQKQINQGEKVALVHATAFTDDRQVMTYLGRHLEQAGLKVILVGPDHLRWNNEQAFVETDWFRGPANFVFRFFPADWLPALSRSCAWWHLLGSSKTPLCNPGSAIITQSKRFPLVWDRLATDMSTWRSLLPATHDPRQRSLLPPESVLKPVFGRVGEMIGMRGVTSHQNSDLIERSARRHPASWIAQERFHAVPLVGHSGNLYPCVGIYTLNERVIGAYGRVARKPLIDHQAQDAAVLICNTDNDRPTPDESYRTLRTVGA